MRLPSPSQAKDSRSPPGFSIASSYVDPEFIFRRHLGARLDQGSGAFIVDRAEKWYVAKLITNVDSGAGRERRNDRPRLRDPLLRRVGEIKRPETVADLLDHVAGILRDTGKTAGSPGP